MSDERIPNTSNSLVYNDNIDIENDYATIEDLNQLNSTINAMRKQIIDLQYRWVDYISYFIFVRTFISSHRQDESVWKLHATIEGMNDKADRTQIIAIYNKFEKYVPYLDFKSLSK